MIRTKTLKPKLPEKLHSIWQCLKVTTEFCVLYWRIKRLIYGTVKRIQCSIRLSWIVSRYIWLYLRFNQNATLKSYRELTPYSCDYIYIGNHEGSENVLRMLLESKKLDLELSHQARNKLLHSGTELATVKSEVVIPNVSSISRCSCSSITVTALHLAAELGSVNSTKLLLTIPKKDTILDIIR